MFNGDRVVLRLERQRDEAGEAARLVLQLAQTSQVVDSVGQAFDVAEEHCAGAAATQLMPCAVYRGPFLCGLLALGDLRADVRCENFRATAGQ